MSKPLTLLRVIVFIIVFWPLVLAVLLILPFTRDEQERMKYDD